jgi:hypothetical protein
MDRNRAFVESLEAFVRAIISDSEPGPDGYTGWGQDETRRRRNELIDAMGGHKKQESPK